VSLHLQVLLLLLLLLLLLSRLRLHLLLLPSNAGALPRLRTARMSSSQTFLAEALAVAATQLREVQLAVRSNTPAVLEALQVRRIPCYSLNCVGVFERQECNSRFGV
jgi:hypothetical protein